jgi:hypothetical protein
LQQGRGCLGGSSGGGPPGSGGGGHPAGQRQACVWSASDSEDGGELGSCSGGEAVPAAAMGDGSLSGGIGGGLLSGSGGGHPTGRRRGKGSGRAMASWEGLRAVFDLAAVERVASSDRVLTKEEDACVLG